MSKLQLRSFFVPFWKFWPLENSLKSRRGQIGAVGRPGSQILSCPLSLVNEMLSCVFCYDRDVWGETEWSGGSWDMAVTVLQSEVSRNTISCSNSHFPPACLSLSLINPNTNYLHNLHYSNSEHRQHHTPHTTRHHTSLQDETPSVYVLHIKIDIYVDICVNSLQWRCLYMFWLMFLWEIINIFFVLVKKAQAGERSQETQR